MKPTNPSLEISTNCSKDRISDLPNDVMQHILSFGTVNDAVKTCSLSRNWGSLWTSIPNLRFRCECRLNDFSNGLYHLRFVHFVDKALMLYSPQKVKTFLLDFEHSYLFKDRVESWLLFAVTHEVEELFLIFGRIYGRYYDWSWTCHWPSLKVLSLEKVILAPNVIRSIFCGSPLIECLTLRMCELTKCERGCCMIGATDTGLKYLTVERCEFQYELYREGNEMCREGFLEIKTPNLLSLNVVGLNGFSFLKLGDLPSLIEANVCFATRSSANREKKMFMSILQKLHHVNRLVVGDWIFQVLTHMKLDGEIFCPTSRSLKINVGLSDAYLHRLKVPLHSFPFLKQLILDAGYSPFLKIDRKNHVAEENYWRSKIGSLECLNHTLEKVEIIGFDVRYHDRNLLEVAQFLLDNAKVLKKLTIHGRIFNQYGPPDLRQAEMWKIEMKEKLLHYPRASPNAVVVVETRRY